VIGEFAQASRNDAADAIGAAAAALHAWRGVGIQQRTDALETIGNEIVARRVELGELLAREEGKTRQDGILEFQRAGQLFRFFAGECARLHGEHTDSLLPGVGVTVNREPLGVISIITPWNFPAAIPAWKIAAALAYGNTVVFKPADLVPASAWALAEVISRAGLPAGAFNLVMGRGAVVGDELTGHPAVDGISFTGSEQVGRAILASAPAAGKRVQLEMGGKNPLVIAADADLPTAVRCALLGAYAQSGQRCTAFSRLIVVEEIHSEFVERLIDALRDFRVGHALEAGIDMGPVVDAKQLSQDLEYISIGIDEGATLAFGGTALERATPGHYLAPTLLTGAHNAMRVAREEIFGPVATVIRVDSYDEALACANDTPYGLTAGIVTRSQKLAEDFRRRSTAGVVCINVAPIVDYHVPFGGRRASGYGPKEMSAHAREFYTSSKTSYFAPT
jgi:aldehyde dehydrogenase (NAD+)